MKAVITLGQGGYEQLQYRTVPRPLPGRGELLVKVLAAGMNNTDINTRVGWYSGGGWGSPTPFPFIQGTDGCGMVEEVGEGISPSLLGTRGLFRPCIRPQGFDSSQMIWLGSDFDGTFAEYVVIPEEEFFPVNTEWTDAELATIPCAYGTAENMLSRAGLSSGETVLIMGASGGVGSAALQLALRRGARVLAQTRGDKEEALLALGAHKVLKSPEDSLSLGSVDLIVDNVGGKGFPARLRLLNQGGRYVSSGAIAGPQVELDLREMYLKDVTLMGTTAWDPQVFPHLIRYIENQEIQPLVAKKYPLEEIVQAQKDFQTKTHVGKYVLIP